MGREITEQLFFYILGMASTLMVIFTIMICIDYCTGIDTKTLDHSLRIILVLMVVAGIALSIVGIPIILKE
jgi:phage-related holin